MDSTDAHKIARSGEHGWSVIASGDNDVDLLQYVIAVRDLTEAAQKAEEIAALVIRHGQSEWTQITLAAWRVQITISAPGNGWWSDSQEQFAAAISRLT